MPLKIERVTLDERSILESLLNIYLHEISAYDAREIDESGNYEYKHLQCYWVEPARHPFFIRVKGRIAGFVLIRDVESVTEEPIHTLVEFFVLNSYRRLGIGEEIARIAFNAFHGKWQVPVPDNNRIARRFFHTVIWRYTGGKMHDLRLASWNGPVFEFSSPGESSALLDKPE
ncbi:MAG: GNAT family N-acetyltransferase [Armatimonadetes bacterium]|nr:GNAT family N-acetyltransferase [Armatimonadota bacterium]